MSSPQTISTPVRRFVSILVMLLLLAVFLSLYFFKYVPQQKNDYNGRAYTELKSVTDAFSGRDDACRQVVLWKTTHLPDKISLDKDNSNKWEIVYGLDSPKFSQRRSLDSIMHLLTDGDRDIFDDYLMILQPHSTKPADSAKDLPHKQKGDILFNSGDLSMDYRVDLDSLLKKSDGFGTMNMYDVKIQGNDYMLFLYPFPFQTEGIIMGGLVSRTHYTARYESVPITLITTGSILLLLLLVAIPLLKIYVIGSHERITTFDLRMIVGTFFIGGLVLFFLFAWNFLESVQTANNKTALKNLSAQLEKKFCQEIDTACLQLKYYDGIYHGDSNLRHSLAQTDLDSAKMDTIKAMHPKLYRQFDDMFWINDCAQWVARWGFKKYETLPKIHVEDRQYFQDMKAGNVLILRKDKELPWQNYIESVWKKAIDSLWKKGMDSLCQNDIDSLSKKDIDTFCLDPTLSKLDGKFVNNIIIHSAVDPCDTGHPIMLGLSVAMYSVCNTILPPEFGFSIVDRAGKILFNSKMDRSLLSNIYTELDDQSTIGQYIRYRQERYIGSTTLHGEQVAMLVAPFKRLPFSVIVYTGLETNQHFELHILSLTSFFIGCIILLLILSAYFNEWSRSRPSLVSISQVDFEWLRPVPAKTGYYTYLLIGMYSLAYCYGLAWVLIEGFLHQHEFYLLSISMLLPFYLAIFYYLLREKQKSLHTRSKKRQAPSAALAIPLSAISTITIYMLCYDPLSPNTWLTLGTQLLFAGLIWLLLLIFTDRWDSTNRRKMLSRYVLAVMTGVLLAVIVPSMALFCFFFKEETRTRNKQENLAMANLICERKDDIKKEKNSYSFNTADSTDFSFLRDLKFFKGVYIPDSTGVPKPSSSAMSIPAHAPEMYYRLRNFLFAGDTTALTFGSNPEWASDSSWFFVREGDSEVLHHEAVWNRDSGRVRLALAHNTRLTALELLRHNAKGLSTVNMLLFVLVIILLLALFRRLTTSLASRIFLLGVFEKYPKGNCQNKKLDEAIAANPALHGLTATAIRQSETKDPGYHLLYFQEHLKDVYKKIWDDLTPREKFVAYDFAIDSLANYKAGTPLHNLIRKGVLCVDKDEQLHFITQSLHNFVLNQSGNRVIRAQLKKAREQGSWQRIRMPLFLLLSAAGIFVFLTQDAIYQKMTGLLTSIGSLVPLISQFFNKSDK